GRDIRGGRAGGGRRPAAAGGRRLRGRRGEGHRPGRGAGRGRGARVPLAERRRHLGRRDRGGAGRRGLRRRRDQGEDGRPRLPGPPRPQLVGEAARRLRDQPRGREGHLRGRRLRGPDAVLPRREGGPHLPRPQGRGRRGRAVPVQAPGDRLRHHPRPDGALPPARPPLRDRPRRPRRRPGGPDEHEHPVLLRAGHAAALAGAVDRERDRRRGRAQQLPGLALRRPGLGAARVAHLRLPPRRARARGVRAPRPAHPRPRRPAGPARPDRDGGPQRLGHRGRRQLGADHRDPDPRRAHHRLRPRAGAERPPLRLGAQRGDGLLRRGRDHRRVGLRALRGALPREQAGAPDQDRGCPGATAGAV
ncbi:MAG: lysophospholipase-like family protein, partial [uncultured Thermomicrobiales bacterium]